MRVRLGPVLLCICVAACRAVWLSLQLSGFHAFEVGLLLLADLPVIGALLALMVGEATIRRPWQIVALLLMVVVVVFYVADALAVFALNARLQLSDLAQFFGEWWVVRSFVSVASVSALVVVAASFFLRVHAGIRLARFVPATAVVLLLLPLAVPDQRIPSHLRKYTGSILLLAKELWGTRWQPISRYRPADFAAYRSEYEALFDAAFARTRKDIVLVIVESLSAVDSHRTSGIRNLLPRLDDLSREGMLFRNFFANFEASEGGIVALASGVPPLHFPTASTNTFGEYALQPSIMGTFKRSGYHSEFLTNVPMQFISMDRYARSPVVGFSDAAGQQETARYKNAPRFAFESPTDHLLYEELLARLDARPRDERQPVLMVLVTASSHPPYVDPLGREGNERNVWDYVQQELWWLHGELAKRGFFDNGLLVITGDHRKMVPIREAEREKFGESAKARIPLIIIGSGVPRDVVDDRLFQQADLLRMLDRATATSAPLSPFVVWVERYVFVFGVASNASNVEIFDAGNGARQGYRLKLQGAEIEWLNRPPYALAVERTIHRQRSMQQAVRTASTIQTALNFGRDLKPSTEQHGMLIGLSSDASLSRDPDDPRGSLKTLTSESFDLDKVLPLAGVSTTPFSLTVRAFLSVTADGQYWFSIHADDASCLAIDKEMVLACQGGLNEGVALLTAGVHRIDLRFVDRGGPQMLRLKWLPPGGKEFTPFPQQELILPEPEH